MAFRRPYGSGSFPAKRQKIGAYRGTAARGRMTFGRNPNRSFGTYRRTGFYNRRYKAPKWAYQSAALASRLGVEKKFTTDNYSDTTVAASWAFPTLTVSDHSATEASSNMVMIAQGNGQSQRVGRKIMLTNISVRWLAARVGVASAVSAPGLVFRFVFYIDRQANGAAVTTSDLFEDIAVDHLQFRNLANSKRFKILKDTTLDLAVVGGAGDGTVANDWSGERISGQFHKILNLPILYNQVSTDGAIATIESNNIGCMCVSSIAEEANFSFNIRARYTDC